MTRPSTESLLTPVLFLALFLALVYGFSLVLRPFVLPLAWASVLAMAIQPVFQKMEARWGAGRASALATVGIALGVMIPALVLAAVAVKQGLDLARRLTTADPATWTQMFGSTRKVWQDLQQRAPFLEQLDLDAFLKDTALKVSREIAGDAGALAQGSLSFIASIVLTLIALFFLLRDGPALVRVLSRLSPLEPGITAEMFRNVRTLTEGSVTAMLLIAVIQGSLGGISTGILGLPSPVIWGIGFALASFIPVVGPMLAWVPAVVWLWIAQGWVKAAIMLLVSVLLIGNVDNVIRPILLSGRSKLNFALSALSVLGGVAAFGMLGLILGPVLVTVLTALMEAYLKNKDERIDREASEARAEGTTL